MVVWMQNSGLEPGQSRKGRQVLGLAKWAMLQAFTEAECQVGHPKLLLRAGTGLEQPSQVWACQKFCCRSLLDLWARWGVERQGWLQPSMLLARHPIARLPARLGLGLSRSREEASWISTSCSSRSVVAHSMGTCGPWAWVEATLPESQCFGPSTCPSRACSLGG